MCEKWKASFSAFLGDMGHPPEGKSLDRINVNGHYEPGNCRWATPKEQANNTRYNVFFEFPSGERLSAAAICILYGVNPSTLEKQIHRNGHAAIVPWVLKKYMRV